MRTTDPPGRWVDSWGLSESPNLQVNQETEELSDKQVSLQEIRPAQEVLEPRDGVRLIPDQPEWLLPT